MTKSWSALPCKFSPWVNNCVITIEKRPTGWTGKALRVNANLPAGRRVVYLNQRRYRDLCRRIGV
ncbi:hypothetical protein DPS92_15480 [Salmonella enterica subsp. enterica serovar Richmond]|nr:hypothetical protein [Salmonella enterica subsp. enterica serovar Typhimurium]EBW4783329.1 hypothetical protein [Salmonella enterica subsp. enterica serovar Richmond]EBW5166907.1 hypothetical protein [Salmonella enterica subsp. enterica serovar Richmond]EBX2813811.1 hypothetical protein [Salmonella enterica subsp. enterica serovar Richmond]